MIKKIAIIVCLPLFLLGSAFAATVILTADAIAYKNNYVTFHAEIAPGVIITLGQL